MDLGHKTEQVKQNASTSAATSVSITRIICTKLIGDNNKFDFTVPVLDVARDYKKTLEC